MIPLAETEAREHEHISEWLATRPVTRESWGLIHGDFERTNFVLGGGVLQLFDFYDACYHWYAADVANALWRFAMHRRTIVRDCSIGSSRDSARCAIDSDVSGQLAWFVRLHTLSLFIARLRGGSRPHHVR